jgi:LemA protein
MSKGLIGCGVIAAIALVLVATAVGSYNRLVELDEGVDNAWSQVENVYQRRADLIPNLIATVKGAKEFEQETLTQVVEARAKVGQVNFETAPDAEQLAQFEAAQSQLSSALSRLLVVVERYPELKATEAFRDLQAQLEGTENRITVERKRFNDATLGYNKTRRRFPTILLANIMGFDDKPYFEATQGADEPPKVEF